MLKKTKMKTIVKNDLSLSNCLGLVNSLMNITYERNIYRTQEEEKNAPKKKDVRDALFEYLNIVRELSDTPFSRFIKKTGFDNQDLAITLALLACFLDGDNKPDPTGRMLLKLITDTPEEFMSAIPRISYGSALSKEEVIEPADPCRGYFVSVRFTIQFGTIYTILGVKNTLYDDKIKRKKKEDEALKQVAPVLSPKLIAAELGKTVIGQEKARMQIAVAVFNHHMRVNDTTGKLANTEKSNILMIGPTGSGKTLLCKTLAGILKLPFVIMNATTITETGYVGGDVQDCLAELYRAAKGDLALAEKGIIYIDEIDKIAASRTEGHNSNRDVSGKSVQEELLGLLEPNIIASTSRHPMDKRSDFPPMNTKNILFIVGGAFAGLDKICAKRLKPQLGFQSNPALVDNLAVVKPEITTEALIEYGMIPEFLGRLPVTAVLDELKEPELVKILKNPGTGLLSQYTSQFEVNNIDLKFDDDALAAVARKSLDRGLGARGLKKILEGVLNDYMYTMFGNTQKKTELLINSKLEGAVRQDIDASKPMPLPLETLSS